MEDDKKMDAGRSLEIISAAIKTSRREAGRSVGTMMTAWGVLGVATSVAIQADSRDERVVEVVSGLQPGDTVLTGVLMHLREGMKVDVEVK